MLNEKQLLDFALKGVNAEIDEIEKKVNQGKKYLQQYENGEKPKTPKTAYEIKKIIKKKNAEIEKLVIYANEIKNGLAKFEK